jgi:hypothetical protein
MIAQSDQGYLVIILIPHTWGPSPISWSVASTFLDYECILVREYDMMGFRTYLSQYYELKAPIRLNVTGESPSLPPPTTACPGPAYTTSATCLHRL